MKRRLQIFTVCLTVLLAIQLMAQDTGAGAGGADTSGGSGGMGESGGTTTAPDNSGASGAGEGSGGGSTTNGGNGNTNSGNTNNGNTNNGNTNNGTDNGTNGGTNGTNGLPQGGADQGQGGAGTGGLMEPLPLEPGATEGTGGSVVVPAPGPEGPPPGFVAPVPGTTPAPTPAGPNSVTAGTQGAVQTAPVTFTLPGGYGGSPSQSFTLGQGRLSKPPITFTLTVSQGYDDNIFSADSHVQATPTPTPGPTPQTQFRLIDYFIGLGQLKPIFQAIKPKAATTPSASQTLGVIGSAVSTATLGAQIQKGSPRTVLTSDFSIGALDYWNRPGGKVDYNGEFDLSMVHRLSPRATLTLAATAVYQKTPDFALINAPTNNGSGGAYLNGDFKADLSYSWTDRVSTVSSYDVNYNFGNDTSNTSSNVYGITYGTQLRYTASARNTITGEFRISEGVYPDNSSADNSSLYYLVGLDTFFSSKLRNTISFGLEEESFSGGGATQTIPYMESATTLTLPRGGGLSWTNRVGSEEPGGSNLKSESYRTGLTLSQPLSTKLVASVSLAYNYVDTTTTNGATGGYTQNEFQTSLSLGYTISPRFSMNLSYTLTDEQTSQVNSSYTRQNIYLGGTYTFR
jgi:hypothetical protein